MIPVEIYETHKIVEIPSSWDELSLVQIQRIFRINDIAIRRGWSEGEARLRILMDILGLKLKPSLVYRISQGGAHKELENLWMLSEMCLSFLFQDGKIRYDSVRNPMPEVRGGLFGTSLTGPADLLSDLSFGEFRHAARALKSFFEHHDLADLDECIAHLYRRKARKANKAGRKVTPFAGESDIKRVARMEAWKKNLIMVWFASCLEYIQTGKIELDGETLDMQLLFSPDDGGNSASAFTGFTWNDLLLQIAKDHIIGTIEDVDGSSLMSILQIMWSNYKEQKRNEKIFKTHKA